MLDLDHFKAINDRWGHPAGDEVLRQVARGLQRCVRAMDSVYRYGGEEFAVLLPDIDFATARAVAERVRGEIENLEISLEAGETIAATISIEVAACPADGASAQELVAATEAALYEAKHGGRNPVSPSANHLLLGACSCDKPTRATNGTAESAISTLAPLEGLFQGR